MLEERGRWRATYNSIPYLPFPSFHLNNATSTLANKCSKALRHSYSRYKSLQTRNSDIRRFSYLKTYRSSDDHDDECETTTPLLPSHPDNFQENKNVIWAYRTSFNRHPWAPLSLVPPVRSDSSPPAKDSPARAFRPKNRSTIGMLFTDLRFIKLPACDDTIQMRIYTERLPERSSKHCTCTHGSNIKEGARLLIDVWLNLWPTVAPCKPHLCC